MVGTLTIFAALGMFEKEVETLKKNLNKLATVRRGQWVSVALTRKDDKTDRLISEMGSGMKKVEVMAGTWAFYLQFSMSALEYAPPRNESSRWWSRGIVEEDPRHNGILVSAGLAVWPDGGAQIWQLYHWRGQEPGKTPLILCKATEMWRGPTRAGDSRRLKSNFRGVKWSLVDVGDLRVPGSLTLSRRRAGVDSLGTNCCVFTRRGYFGGLANVEVRIED